MNFLGVILQMKNVKLIKKYARLIAEFGLNASNKQDVVIEANVEHHDFVPYLVNELYNLHVRGILVTYVDETVKKLSLLKAPIKKLEKVEKWEVEKFKEETENHMARIILVGSNPEMLKKVKPEAKRAYQKARKEAFYQYVDKYNSNELTWCKVAVPTRSWAKKVFPNDTPTQAYDKLWDCIFKACRIEEENFPIEEYEQHISILQRKATILTNMNIKTLHYTNSLGTDLEIGLPKKAIWKCAQSEEGYSGHLFTPNIPTEEVYTSPHRDRVNGIVYSSKPLAFEGDLIKNFYLKFKNGVVVDFNAEEGYEKLKAIIEFDSDSNRLGEVALVPFHSPISNLKTTFFLTLLDENAACHLALGDSFGDCIQNGENLEPIELINKGLNCSKMHCDFMIGTTDLKITATSYDSDENREITIFENGDWAL